MNKKSMPQNGSVFNWINLPQDGMINLLSYLLDGNDWRSKCQMSTWHCGSQFAMTIAHPDRHIFRPSVSMLFDYLVSHTSQGRVSLDTAEYMQVRGLRNRRGARDMMVADALTLVDLSVTYRGRLSFDGALIQHYRVSRGRLDIQWTDAFTRHLSCCPKMPYCLQLQQLDTNHQRLEYTIARRLLVQYRMDKGEVTDHRLPLDSLRKMLWCRPEEQLRHEAGVWFNRKYMYPLLRAMKNLENYGFMARFCDHEGQPVHLETVKDWSTVWVVFAVPVSIPDILSKQERKERQRMYQRAKENSLRGVKDAWVQFRAFMHRLTSHFKRDRRSENEFAEWFMAHPEADYFAARRAYWSDGGSRAALHIFENSGMPERPIEGISADVENSDQNGEKRCNTEETSGSVKEKIVFVSTGMPPILSDIYPEEEEPVGKLSLEAMMGPIVNDRHIGTPPSPLHVGKGTTGLFKQHAEYKNDTPGTDFSDRFLQAQEMYPNNPLSNE